ncbi:lysophospholipid acyltransferase family protein [Rhizobium sp. BK377]|uniref:lysophospholipid acyltransferase family protein n=1 Tax=Rhizobium sp. BK377 TaxID=2587058 RepID=UPI00160F6482|nr:lysophospholipid acyltransferase family protein [Rhizobium sp. BK377]MBB3463042.1 1-acyl-sn-glycerol-3-phosphate acyltransferase [Rhizobium sp. BK377]
MKALLTTAAATVIVLFARAVTAVRAVWPEAGLPSRPCVYYANHSSHGDFVLVWTVLPPRLRHRTRPVAGAEYWLKSSLNRFVGSDVFNAVLIARERDKRTEDPVTQMVSAIDAGSSLILFPEGTRNQSDAKLLPFKSGIYHLAAARSDIDLVPVWISNLNRVMPKGEIVPIPLICTVTFGSALQIAPGESKDIFLERMQAALLALAPNSVGGGE